jgi:type III pantothenate kinase
MLLAIDIGNTNIVLGVFDGERLSESWRLATLRERTADEHGILVTQLFDQRKIDPGRITGIIVSSVVPTLTRPIEEMALRLFGRSPLTVDPANTGMPVRYTPASDVGADRVANGVAAYERHGRSTRSPVIVVDFGTATTFDAISAAGEYMGGVICPGIGISADALFQKTARLPRVAIRKPARVIGTTTVGSLQSGLYYGYLGLVDGILERLLEEMGGETTVVATGGLAALIGKGSKYIKHVDDLLTLDGLRLIWERNLEAKSGREGGAALKDSSTTTPGRKPRSR